MSWTAPENAGPAITGYGVRYRAGTSGSWSSHSHTGTGTSTTITGLTASTGYLVQVRATNAEGTGPWSASGIVIHHIVPEKGGVAEWRLSLAEAPTQPITITPRIMEKLFDTPKSATDVSSSDVCADLAPLVIDATNWNSDPLPSITCTVQDDEYDLDRTITVTHTVNDPNGLVEMPDVTIEVEDDDERGVMMSAERLDIIEGESDTYLVSLKTKPLNDVSEVTVFLRVLENNTSGERSELASLSPTRVYFNPGNWDQPQEVTVSAIVDKYDPENDHIVIEHRTSGPGYYDTEREYSDLFIEDIHESEIHFSEVEYPSSGIARYRVTLGYRPGQAVTLHARANW